MLGILLLAVAFFGACLMTSPHAQPLERRDMVWLFGPQIEQPPKWGGDFQTSLDLSTYAPVFTTGHFAMPFHVTYAGICDTAGQLLLYSNGTSVANGFHEIIEGGDTLTLDTIDQYFLGFGLMRKPQGALLLPNPADNGIYYLFHEELQLLYDWSQNLTRPRIQNIYLTTIDAYANNGHGKVLEKSAVLAHDSLLFNLGKIVTTRHANGRDWWVIVPRLQSTHVARFLVTPDGVQVMPDIVVPTLMYPNGDPEQAAFSPDGSRYANKGFNFANDKHYLYLFNFDRCTGELYNQQVKYEPAPYAWSTFFSPNGRFLYWVYHDDNSYVKQFDLEDPNWFQNGVNVLDWDGTWYPFPTAPIYGYNAPDGKIYITCGNGVKSMHVIHRPNEPGAACQVEQNIELPAVNYVTIPNFPNFRLGPLDDSACDTLGLDNHPVANFRWETPLPAHYEFTDLSYHEPAVWAWNFGDGATSADTNPAHAYALPGAYNVCLTVTNPHGSSTRCRAIDVPVSATEPGAELPGVRVGPNPFRDRLLVQGPAAAGPLVFRLFDALGQPALARLLDAPTLSIETAALPPGWYAWDLRDSAGRRRAGGQVVKVGR